MEPREEGSGLRLPEGGACPTPWPGPDLRGCRGDPPAVALLLVQLLLVLVDVEFSDQGVEVGAAQVLVGVVQKQLVVQFFLPPPQLAAGGIQLLFALLENGGDDSHGGQAHQGRCGTCHLEGDCREHGADPTVCWDLPRRARVCFNQR